MKKAMKLVWMVLFALPMVAFTACDNDEPDNGKSFKDYSNLLNKTLTDILDKEMKNYQPYIQPDGSGVSYFDDANELGNNIENVNVWFTFFDEDAQGNYIMYPKSVVVESYVEDFAEWEIKNYLTDKYGKSEQFEDGGYQYTYGNMYIWLDYVEDTGDWVVSYLNKKEYDALGKNVQALRRALKARRR